MLHDYCKTMDSTMSNLNVFHGPSSVRDYFDPDLQPPVPLVELPDRLNPFREDNVRIYAKMLTALPAQNVKALPAMNMLLNEPEAAHKSIVEASSGSTALSLAMLSRVLNGNEDVCAYLTNKKHPDQLKILRFFGCKISLYGGLAQQEPVDPRGIMCRLRRLAKEDKNVIYPGQYDNDHNWKSHVKWTGRQIFQQLPQVNVLSSTVGTGGCITGTGSYLKAQKASVRVVGVMNVFGDPTPGPRHYENFDSSPFPWRETIDDFENVASRQSYEWSMRLSREGLICGPSSGEALYGLFQFLRKRKAAGTLEELAEQGTGEISCVFICCDLPYQYMDGYFNKLDAASFPPIYNSNLMGCDQDKYDERWELSCDRARKLITSRLRKGARVLTTFDTTRTRSPNTRKRLSPRELVLDLRQKRDFGALHIAGSINQQLACNTSTTGDIFGDASLLETCWRELQRVLSKHKALVDVKKRPLIVLCYNGEVSRMATSILRAKGHVAFSVLGGFPALADCIESGKVSPPDSSSGDCD